METKNKKTVIILSRTIPIAILCLIAYGLLIYYSIIGVAPIKKKHMREYYQNDANYYSVSGVIKSLKKEKGFIVFSEVVDSDELLYLNSAYRVFASNMSALLEELDLKEGDVIEIITAKRNFWDSYKHPIVSIKKDGIEYLSFEEGKAALLDWVNNLK